MKDIAWYGNKHIMHTKLMTYNDKCARHALFCNIHASTHHLETFSNPTHSHIL